MHSQIYLSGKLQGNPEVLQTRKGKPWIRILLETGLVRPDGRGALQTESIILPINFFSREAEAIKDLKAGSKLVLGAHLYGTKFESDSGAVKHGIQLVADAVFTTPGVRSN